jgi:hypothetical protein
MQSIDFEDEECPVPKSVCLTLQCFDFVVGSFQWPGRDRMVIVSEDSSLVGSQRLGNVFEYFDA